MGAPVRDANESDQARSDQARIDQTRIDQARIDQARSHAIGTPPDPPVLPGHPVPSGPLAGIRVCDLSTVLAGPYCTMLLADLGADVIKVEPPEGDGTRRWGPPWAGAPEPGTAYALDDPRAHPGYPGEAAYYLAVNRNKRGIRLDLKTEAGREVLRRLLATSDVLVENYRVGGLARLGFPDAELERLNPGLVHLAISGFGPDGPYAERPGYDFIVQAMSGLMSITGAPDEAGGEPTKVGVAVVDLATGMLGTVSVLSALLARDRPGAPAAGPELAVEQAPAAGPALAVGGAPAAGPALAVGGAPAAGPERAGSAVGRDLQALPIDPTQAKASGPVRGAGQRIDISLFESTIAWLANQASNYLVGGTVPGRLGNQHPNITPYETFRTADGSIAVAVGSDRQWPRFCEAVGLSDLAHDLRFATNGSRVGHRAELRSILGARFATRPSSEWIERLLAAEVPSGPINDLAAVFSDPQAQARHMVESVTHPTIGTLRTTGLPFKLTATPGSVRTAPPLLGQHTDAVLAELGFGPDEIARMRTEGAT